jgi:hypothetical protein
LEDGKSPEQAREAAYEVGAYRYMDDEIMGSLQRAGSEIMAGTSTLWGENADAKAYEQVKNNLNIPEVYKQRLLTKIAGNGTDLAIDALTTFTPVGRAVGMVQSFGRGRLDAAERGADFWGQVGGGVVHGATDKVMGKTARTAKAGSNRLIDAVPGTGPAQQLTKQGGKRVIGTLINIGEKEASKQTKTKAMDEIFGRWIKR